MEDLGGRIWQHKREGNGRDVAWTHDGDEGLTPGRWGDSMEEVIPVDLRRGPEHISGDQRAWVVVGDMMEEDGLLGVAIGECVARHPPADRNKGFLKAGMGPWVHRARKVTLFGQVLVLL